MKACIFAVSAELKAAIYVLIAIPAGVRGRSTALADTVAHVIAIAAMMIFISAFLLEKDARYFPFRGVTARRIADNGIGVGTICPPLKMLVF
jgi:hypothetical protein